MYQENKTLSIFLAQKNCTNNLSFKTKMGYQNLKKAKHIQQAGAKIKWKKVNQFIRAFHLILHNKRAWLHLTQCVIMKLQKISIFNLYKVILKKCKKNIWTTKNQKTKTQFYNHIIVQEKITKWTKGRNHNKLLNKKNQLNCQHQMHCHSKFLKI